MINATQEYFYRCGIICFNSLENFAVKEIISTYSSAEEVFGPETIQSSEHSVCISKWMKWGLNQVNYFNERGFS